MQTKTTNAIEQKLFASICFVVMILCSIGFLVNLLLTGTWITTSTSFFGLVLISLLFFFRDKISHEIGVLVLIFMGFVIINIFWFQTEGLAGVSPLLFIIYAVAITIVLPQKFYPYFISFVLANIIVLLLLQSFSPLYITYYKSPFTKEWDIITTIFTTVMTTTLTVLFFKKAHIKNQLAIEERNAALLKSQKELLLSKEKIEDANNIKSSFLAVMNHEVRTPLNAIIGISHLLNQYEYETSQKTELVLALNKSSHQLLNLLNEVLDFNKIEAGELSLNFQELNITTLVAQLKKELSEAAQAKQNELKFCIDANIPDLVILDKEKIHQILHNLISNAIKFTSNGTITVNITTTNNRDSSAILFFEVKDTGIGIETNQQEYIFKQFSQIPNSSQQTNGIGLGLAIVTRLLDLMGSKISVESSPEKGSRFYFSLECVVIPSNKQNQISPLTMENKKVLLVEDNQTNVLVLSHFLKKWGIAFEVAHNGLEALSFYKKQPFKLILMDMQMPEMDGFEATEEIRKSNSNIPIIALTASATSQEKQRAELAGVNDYITKPFDPQHLHGVIQKYMLAS